MQGNITMMKLILATTLVLTSVAQAADLPLPRPRPSPQRVTGMMSDAEYARYLDAIVTQMRAKQSR